MLQVLHVLIANNFSVHLEVVIKIYYYDGFLWIGSTQQLVGYTRSTEFLNILFIFVIVMSSTENWREKYSHSLIKKYRFRFLRITFQFKSLKRMPSLNECDLPRRSGNQVGGSEKAAGSEEYRQLSYAYSFFSSFFFLTCSFTNCKMYQPTEGISMCF